MKPQQRHIIRKEGAISVAPRSGPYTDTDLPRPMRMYLQLLPESGGVALDGAKFSACDKDRFKKLLPYSVAVSLVQELTGGVNAV